MKVNAVSVLKRRIEKVWGTNGNVAGSAVTFSVPSPHETAGKPGMDVLHPVEPSFPTEKLPTSNSSVQSPSMRNTSYLPVSIPRNWATIVSRAALLG